MDLTLQPVVVTQLSRVQWGAGQWADGPPVCEPALDVVPLVYLQAQALITEQA